MLGQLLGGGLHPQLVFSFRHHLDDTIHDVAGPHPVSLLFKQPDDFLAVLPKKPAAQGQNTFGIRSLILWQAGHSTSRTLAVPAGRA